MADLDGIRHALTLARDRGFAEVAVECGDLKFRGTLEPAPRRKAVSQAPSEVSQAVEEAEPGLEAIRAPLVGYFRASETPLEAGHTVAVGDVIGVVASLGDIPYAVESAVAGEVVEVLIAPDQPVEYGQVLARVRA